MPFLLQKIMKLSSLNRLRTKDEYRWLLENAKRIEDNQPHDDAGLRIFLLEMSKSDEHGLRSRFRILIGHLLKAQYQSKKKTRSWDVTILNQRDDLSAVLQDSATLRNFAQVNLEKYYQLGVEFASVQTGLPASTFPPTCPWTIKQILGIL